MFLLPHTYMQALAPPQMVYVRDGSSAIKSTKVQEIDERTRSPDESCWRDIKVLSTSSAF